MLSSIDILDIKKRQNSIEREYLFTDKQYKIVPNVIGMEVNEAVKQLKDFKVEYSGSGEKITYQNPSANSEIYEGETVRLLLS